jgi:hypothetical protein
MQKIVVILILTIVTVYLVVLLGCAVNQRRMIFFPTHYEPEADLAPWTADGILIGHARPADDPEAIWLVLHGNAGQASGRGYILPCFPADDAVFVLEYPGYGSRPGSPSKESFDAAAEEALLELRRRYPGKPVCVVGESIGSGPAAHLGTVENPPDKIVLVVPFDELAAVAAQRMPFLPVRWLLRDNWDNVEALRNYQGSSEIHGATDDEIIPVQHARELAARLDRAVFHEFNGRHNDWSINGNVRLRHP